MLALPFSIVYNAAMKPEEAKNRKTGDLTHEKAPDGKRPARNQKVGERGEKTASRYLERCGYRIVERNFRCRSGEIDIVAVKEPDDAEDGRALPTVVFVEVKARNNLSYGVPSLAVTAEKQRHLLKAARLYAKRFGLENVPCRYDVIEILFLDGRTYLRHIRNAFS